MHPTKLTQTEAARAAGLTRTSIWRAIKRGRLSVERGDDGSVLIDASELLRLFPKADLERAQVRAPRNAMYVSERGSTHADFTALHALIDELKVDKLHLHAQLHHAADERAQLAEERARLSEERTQLLAMLREQAEQVRLLTDQRAKKKSWWRRVW
jgi:hypothetical protein